MQVITIRAYISINSQSDRNVRFLHPGRTTCLASSDYQLNSKAVLKDLPAPAIYFTSLNKKVARGRGRAHYRNNCVATS